MVSEPSSELFLFGMEVFFGRPFTGKVEFTFGKFLIFSSCFRFAASFNLKIFYETFYVELLLRELALKGTYSDFCFFAFFQRILNVFGMRGLLFFALLCWTENEELGRLFAFDLRIVQHQAESLSRRARRVELKGNQLSSLELLKLTAFPQLQSQERRYPSLVQNSHFRVAETWNKSIFWPN